MEGKTPLPCRKGRGDPRGHPGLPPAPVSISPAERTSNPRRRDLGPPAPMMMLPAMWGLSLSCTSLSGRRGNGERSPTALCKDRTVREAGEGGRWFSCCSQRSGVEVGPCLLPFPPHTHIHTAKEALLLHCHRHSTHPHPRKGFCSPGRASLGPGQILRWGCYQPSPWQRDPSVEPLWMVCPNDCFNIKGYFDIPTGCKPAREGKIPT